MNVKKFFHELEALKNLRRSGWVRFKIKKPESVADHSFRVAVMAMVLAPKLGLNVEKCIKMALLHDLSEIRVGDIVVKSSDPNYRTQEKEKFQKEKNSIKKILSNLDKNQADEFFKSWLEVGMKTSAEGKFVNELDKLEMVFQALEYERENRSKTRLDEFFEDAEKRIEIPELLKLLKEVKQERSKLFKHSSKA
jgi:putative hydrolase of HD superfamily